MEKKKKDKLDMSRFRRDLRMMWAVMKFRYHIGDPQWFRTEFPEIQILKPKRADEEVKD